MKTLKRFEEFIKDGTIVKQSADPQRAQSLLHEAAGKSAFFEKVLTLMPFSEVNPNYVVETCYDVIMETIRAKMHLDGFKSKESHEAEVAYLRTLGLSEPDVQFMNDLRYFRNGIKYYGRILDADYAKKVKTFFEKVHPALLKKIS